MQTRGGILYSFFPTPTAGDGQIRPPYRKVTDGQGGSVATRRVSCAQCGFPGADFNRDDHSGGTLDGSGALGVITQQGTGADGNQAYNTNGGCSLCGSKNFVGRTRRQDEFTRSSSVDVLR